jgi:hypothetical protein
MKIFNKKIKKDTVWQKSKIEPGLLNVQKSVVIFCVFCYVAARVVVIMH